MEEYNAEEIFLNLEKEAQEILRKNKSPLPGIDIEAILEEAGREVDAAGGDE